MVQSATNTNVLPGSSQLLPIRHTPAKVGLPSPPVKPSQPMGLPPPPVGGPPAAGKQANVKNTNTMNNNQGMGNLPQQKSPIASQQHRTVAESQLKGNERIEQPMSISHYSNTPLSPAGGAATTETGTETEIRKKHEVVTYTSGQNSAEVCHDDITINIGTQQI